MVEIACMMLIGITIMTILYIVFSSNKAKASEVLVPIYAVSVALALLASYLDMPVRRLVGIVGINIISVILVLLVLALVSFASMGRLYSEMFFKSKVFLSVCVGIALALVFEVGVGVNSRYNVKTTYNSINASVSKSREAPTLKKGQTPVAIAPNTVFNKVSKAMDEVPNSNYYEIAENNEHHKEIQAQYRHGEPVYVIPIMYRGFWRYHHQHYIPGYFQISAVNPNAKPRFIRQRINYSDSSYFNHNVERDIYRYSRDCIPMSDNAQLEISNNGKPYYVETLYRSRWDNNLPNFRYLKIAVANARSGKVRIYDRLNRTPKFIDENLTSDVANEVDSYYGALKHGFWNSRRWGRQVGVKKPTLNGPEDGVTTVFDRKGQIHYITDFTSTSNNTHSALGYSSINARTGKLTYYKTHGVMDTDGAYDNANRNYHAQDFHAEMPVLYSISGHPTWVMSILDNSGLQRGFYMVDGDNPSTHADSYDSNSCLSSFEQALASSNSSIKNSSQTFSRKVHGTILRDFVSSDKSEALIELKGDKEVYIVNTNEYKKANLIKPGDNVRFRANHNSTYGTATDFSDLNL